MSKKATKKKIVIIGGGFSGAYCAQNLEKRINHSEVEIYLIDRNNYLTFYPLLIEAGTGRLEPRHSVVSIRKFLDKTSFRMGEVENVNFEKSVVEYQLQGESFQLEYDHIVLALGSTTNLPPIPGLKEHGFELKSLSDAVALRNRSTQLLELADTRMEPEQKESLLRMIVVGSNFTGVEVAGEFDIYLKEATQYYSNLKASDCNITLVEIVDRILPAIDSDLAEYAAEKMKSRGIDILLNSSITEVKKDQVTFKNGKKLGTHTVVWCAGIAPNPLIEKLDIPKDKRGYIICEKDTRVKGFTNVWAIGDCAVNTDPDDNPYPPTAQHAVLEAEGTAKNINRVLNNEQTQPLKLESKGALAAIGCRSAVAKIFGIKLSGFTAWFLYRTVYLFKMPGWARRFRIALDWTIDLFFKREYVQTGIHNKSTI